MVDFENPDDFRSPTKPGTVVHLVYIPPAARQEMTCFRWQQANTPGLFSKTKKGGSSGVFNGCWALDNVLIVNTAHTPLYLEEQFDPVDPSNWLFFPGASIKVGICCLLINFSKHEYDITYRDSVIVIANYRYLSESKLKLSKDGIFISATVTVLSDVTLHWSHDQR